MTTKLYQDRKSAGLCPYCGEPAKNGKVYCQKCIDYQVKYKKTKRLSYDDGMCIQCGKESAEDGKRRCRKCLDNQASKQKEYRLQCKKNGRCKDCKKPVVPGKTRCADCLIRMIAWDVGHSVKTVKKIYDSQNGICPYSGRKLILGVDASIDHRIPKSKGGTDDVSNLQWVHKDINLAKQALTEDKFFELIKDCAIHLEIV